MTDDEKEERDQGFLDRAWRCASGERLLQRRDVPDFRKGFDDARALAGWMTLFAAFTASVITAHFWLEPSRPDVRQGHTQTVNPKPRPMKEPMTVGQCLAVGTAPLAAGAAGYMAGGWIYAAYALSRTRRKNGPDHVP